MISLALLGKDISHSKSKEIYEGHLGQEINYQIIDCSKESDIPTLNEIFQKNQGLSITSPYKRFFLDQVTMPEQFKALKAINCIRKVGDIFEAINTDYLAIDEILDEFIIDYGDLYVVILGDGVMSGITQNLLNLKDIPFSCFSRKETPDFNKLNIPNLVGEKENQVLIINSCSREFKFEGVLAQSYLFWDYNYELTSHFASIPNQVTRYVDGFSLLNIQGKYALKFWDF